MNALLHTHPPPCKLIVCSDREDDLHAAATFIEWHDESYGPSLHIADHTLIIVFATTPDTTMRRLISMNIIDICNDAEIHWEIPHNEDTTL